MKGTSVARPVGNDAAAYAFARRRGGPSQKQFSTTNGVNALRQRTLAQRTGYSLAARRKTSSARSRRATDCHQRERQGTALRSSRHCRRPNPFILVIRRDDPADRRTGSKPCRSLTASYRSAAALRRSAAAADEGTAAYAPPVKRSSRRRRAAATVNRGTRRTRAKKLSSNDRRCARSSFKKLAPHHLTARRAGR